MPEPDAPPYFPGWAYDLEPLDATGVLARMEREALTLKLLESLDPPGRVPGEWPLEAVLQGLSISMLMETREGSGAKDGD